MTAPGAREQVPAARRRRLLLAVLLAVGLLVALAVVLARLSAGDDSLVAAGQDTAQQCPAEVSVGDGVRIPPLPATGPADRLVPSEAPDAVLLCRYGDAQPADGAGAGPGTVGLDAGRSLQSGLEQVPLDLALPAGADPGPCTAAGGPVIPYLVQLRYADDVVWLRTHEDPNSCALITNGAFSSAVYLGRQVAASFDAGAWVAPPRPAGRPDCPWQTSGRAGQESALVPAGWDRLLVCRVQESGETVSPAEEPTAEAVASLLSGLSTEPAEGFSAGCADGPVIDGHDRTQYTLVFQYPAGRGVQVVPFFGCSPAVSNGTLAAEATEQQQEELLRLLKGD